MNAAGRLGRLEDPGGGVWAAPGARVIDRSGKKRLPIGWDSYAAVMGTSVIVDKSQLIADVVDSGYSAILFCRPSRFGSSTVATLRSWRDTPTAATATPSAF